MDRALEASIAARLREGDEAGATTLAVRGYGPAIASYLRAVLRDEQAAADAFSIFGELLWKGIAGFRGEASFETWAYHVAFSAVTRHLADPYRRRARRLSTAELSGLVAEVMSSGRGEIDRLARLRESLSPEDQTLLILRVDRGLSFREIARVMAQGDEAIGEAALRKRYERLKLRLRQQAKDEGLIEG